MSESNGFQKSTIFVRKNLVCQELVSTLVNLPYKFFLPLPYLVTKGLLNKIGPKGSHSCWCNTDDLFLFRSSFPLSESQLMLTHGLVKFLPKN